MEILVCVKQVPDTEELKIDLVTGKRHMAEVLPLFQWVQKKQRQL
jgi:electron transfer flavoprotein alpha/beta subunit